MPKRTPNVGYVYELTCRDDGMKYIGMRLGLPEEGPRLGSITALNTKIGRLGGDNFDKEILYVGPAYIAMKELFLNDRVAQNPGAYDNIALVAYAPGHEGKTHDTKAKDAIAAANVGKTSPMKGKSHSPESLAKIRGHKRTPEQRARISAAVKGIPKSEEFKEKQRALALNRTPEHTAKLNAGRSSEAARLKKQATWEAKKGTPRAEGLSEKLKAAWVIRKAKAAAVEA